MPVPKRRLYRFPTRYRPFGILAWNFQTGFFCVWCAVSRRFAAGRETKAGGELGGGERGELGHFLEGTKQIASDLVNEKNKN